jgi:hypothetical protein
MTQNHQPERQNYTIIHGWEQFYLFITNIINIVHIPNT